MNITGRRLREERKRLNLSQAEVAQRLKLSRPAYVKYETGTSTPQLKSLIILAEIFSVSTDYLLGKTDDRAAIMNSQNSPLNEDAIKAWLRQVCKDNPRALEAIERIEIKSTGEIVLPGTDTADPLFQLSLKGITAALEAALIKPDGTKEGIWKPEK